MSPDHVIETVRRSVCRIVILSCVTASAGCGFVSRHWSNTPDRPASPTVPATSAPAQPPPDLKAAARTEPPSAAHSDARVDIGCVAADQLQNRYTPADLYPAMAKCLAQSDFKKAVLISALAGTYARFDSLRVADATAHDAGIALTLQATSNVSDEQKKTFRTTMQSMRANPAEFAALCKDIERVGPPSYFPMYMIEHGTTSSGENGGSVLVPDFDIADGWQTALDTYMHCPKP